MHLCINSLYAPCATTGRGGLAAWKEYAPAMHWKLYFVRLVSYVKALMEKEDIDLRTTLTIAGAGERGRDSAGRKASNLNKVGVLREASIVL